ncbi:hypothetical protein NC652_006611 [Populus alba x Populus x berolinensis]|nr:hypothetical protein NC652_006611 [Populus alba x Populus x berolinensis]
MASVPYTNRSGEGFTKPKILFGKGLQKHLSRLQRRPLKRRALSLKGV